MTLKQFEHPTYLIRSKVFTVSGRSFNVLDPAGNLILFSHMKGFRLKEDIRLYSSPDMSRELLVIQARQIIDFSTTYDVFDPDENRKVGSFRRRGLKSLMRDEWVLMNTLGHETGKIREESAMLAFLRRLLGPIVPQRYVASTGGMEVAHFSQKFNPFLLKLRLDFTADRENLLDRRLGLAAGLLLCAIEARRG